MNLSPANTRPSAGWPIFRALAGWRLADLGPDFTAGLTLAAIAIPEQMATARLGGYSAVTGFVVFIAATIGVAIFGSSRVLSVGADSTITPIFAGALALIAVSGSHAYFELAALLALMTGVILIGSGLFRMGWIANLLSIPVMTGFLAGIAIHIVISQLPTLLGVTVAHDDVVRRVADIAADLSSVNIYAVTLGLGVFAVTFASEKIDKRIPGALIGLLGATLLAFLFNLEGHGVAAIGVLPDVTLRPQLPGVSFGDVIRLVPLALTVAIVMMIQTSATTRAFPGGDGQPDVNRDFIGVGVGNILSGLFGGFAVNASPPRTGAVAETGGRSQFAGLLAALTVALLLFFGTRLLVHVPRAALAGVLFFVAQRIIRAPVFVKTWQQSPGEFLLILVTAIAVVVLPIQTGVSLSILLSLLHGVWTMTRARPIEFERIPGTSIWWPQNPKSKGERLDGIMVLAFQAPLAFLNANIFERDTLQAIDSRPALKCVVLEASSIVEIDFTAAQSLSKIVSHCQARNIHFAVARLESTRAQAAFERFGLLKLLGEDRLFHSVQDAIQTITPLIPNRAQKPPL